MNRLELISDEELEELEEKSERLESIDLHNIRYAISGVYNDEGLFEVELKDEDIKIFYLIERNFIQVVAINMRGMSMYSSTAYSFFTKTFYKSKDIGSLKGRWMTLDNISNDLIDAYTEDLNGYLKEVARVDDRRS